MKYFYLLVIAAVLTNIIQLPFIINTAPENWRSIHINNSSDIVETALDNDRDTLTQTHNLYMILGKHAPSSTLFVSDKPDAESASKLYGLAEVKEIKKRNLDSIELLKKINPELKPAYSGVMWTSPAHKKSGVRGIEWKIYLGPEAAPELLFIKSVEDNGWFIIDKVLFTEKELKDVCDDC